MKRIFLFFIFVAAAAHGQVNNPAVRYVSVAPSGACIGAPPIQVLNSTGAVYTCNNGTWGAQTSSGGVPPGCTQPNGSGSLSCTTLAAANGVQTLRASSQYANGGNTVTAEQPQNNYTLRQTLTKIANMQSSATQIRIAIVGDSSASFHNLEAACAIAGGVLPTGTTITAGYIGGGGFGSGTFPCPSGVGGNTNVLSGGATQVSQDFTHFPNGAGFNIPSGGCVTWGSGGSYFNSNLNAVLYDSEPSAGTITINTNNNGAGWVQQYTGSAANATRIGTVWQQTVGSVAPYEVQACASGGAAVNVWNEAQINTTINGVVMVWMGEPGTNVPDWTTNASAVFTPFLAFANVDLVMNEWRLNGNWNSGCQLSGNVNSSTYNTWSYWFNLLMGEFTAAQPLADVEIIGGYPNQGDEGSTTTGCNAIKNQQSAAWAVTNNQTFVDLYYPVNGSTTLEQAYGWIDTSTHQLLAGQLAEGGLLVQQLGIYNWPNVVSPKDTNNTNTTTQNLYLGNNNKLYSPTQDLQLNLNRAFSLRNASGAEFGLLSPPASTAGSSNYLPPFQLSNYSAATGPFMYRWDANTGGPSATNNGGGTVPRWLAGEYLLSAYSASVSGTYQINMLNGGFQTLTLTGNTTLSNPSNIFGGDLLNLRLCQDATGGRTVAPGGSYFGSGNLPISLAANTCTTLSLVFNSYFHALAPPVVDPTSGQNNLGVATIKGFTTLALGTVTVTNANACTPSATCVYKLSNCGLNGSTAVGVLSVGTVSAGTSFVINSESAAAAVVTLDTSNICWQIN